MEYAPAMRFRTTRPLYGDTAATDGVKQVLRTLDAYSLTLEDRNAILEITQWPGGDDPMSDVTTKVSIQVFNSGYCNRNAQVQFCARAAYDKSEIVSAGSAEGFLFEHVLYLFLQYFFVQRAFYTVKAT